LIYPFFHNDKLIFHLSVTRGHDNVNRIESNLPWELIQQCSTYKQRMLIESNSEIDYTVLLKKIARQIINCSVSKYFYYSDFLLDFTGKNLTFGTYDRLQRIPYGIDIMPGQYFSKNSLPLKFHKLKQHYYSHYFFRRNEFDKDALISTRKKYEINLHNRQAQSDYVEVYASSNSFLSFKEEGMLIRVLLNNKIPSSLYVIHA